jgi:hypothetical protein
MIFKPDMAAVFMTMPKMTYSPVDLAQRMHAFTKIVAPCITRIAEIESVRQPATYLASDGAVIPGYARLSARAERAITAMHFEIESLRRLHFP